MRVVCKSLDHYPQKQPKMRVVCDNSDHYPHLEMGMPWAFGPVRLRSGTPLRGYPPHSLRSRVPSAHEAAAGHAARRRPATPAAASPLPTRASTLCCRLAKMTSVTKIPQYSKVFFTEKLILFNKELFIVISSHHPITARLVIFIIRASQKRTVFPFPDN